MTGNKLPPFNQLEDRNKPKAPPPLSEVTQTKGPKISSSTEVAADAAAQKEKKTKEKHKKVKKAESLTTFAARHSKGHAMFFRHIRVPDPHNLEDPSDLNSAMLPGPKGGATVLVDMLNDEEFRFSFAICNLEEGDSYVKDEARFMCQDRFANDVTVFVSNRDKELSCFENIYYAIGGLLGKNNPKTATIESTADGISNAELSTLRRYIKNYGSTSKDGETWPFPVPKD